MKISILSTRWMLPVFALAMSGFLFQACEEDDGGDPSLTEAEVIRGLKSALEVGTNSAVSILNVEDGYYGDDIVKILLPPEAAPIFDNISSVPGGTELLENTIKSVNRAAEDAAVEATPIFIDAITGITIADGFNILNGADNAATEYLRVNTYSGLQGAFQPKIETSLSKEIILGVSAENAYSSLISTYNTASLGGILFPMVTDNTLSEYTTEKALDGLFVKVADEEKNIRLNPVARINDILTKVFGTLD